MRFSALHLRAYGPFAEAVLDWQTPTPGLQIVYGPNERGKSTALRALSALLFGFPVRTDDHFGRELRQLRVGAVLADEAGQQLAIMRRKGNKNTLFEFDPVAGQEWPDRLIDESRLQRLLGGIDSDRYETLYALGSERLRAGGRALLDSGSSFGAAVFAATSGVLELRQVAQTLQTEADRIFKPLARNLVLNQQLSALEAHQQQARAAVLQPADWSARQAAREHAVAEVLRIEEALRADRERLARIERVLTLQPPMQRRARLQAERVALGRVPDWPRSVGQDVAALRQTAAQADHTQRAARERLANEMAQRATLRPSQPHRTAAVAIVQLAGRLPALDAAGAALLAAQAQCAQAELRCTELIALLDAEGAAVAGGAAPGGASKNFAKIADSADLADLSAGADAAGVPSTALQRAQAPAPGAPDATQDAATRRAFWMAALPPPSALSQARPLIARQQQRRARQQALTLDAARVGREADAAAEALAELPAPRACAALAAAIEAVQAAGDIEPRAAQRHAQLAAADRQLVAWASALGSDPQTLVHHVRVPAAEVDRVLHALRECDTEMARLTGQHAALTHTLQTLRTQQAARLTEGRVLDRDALKALRQQRDQVVEHVWSADAAARASLAPQVRTAIEQADAGADARFADAARLTELEALATRVNETEAALAELAAALAAQQTRAERLRADWAERLAALGLPARDPLGWHEWAAGVQRVADAWAARTALAAEHEALVGTTAGLRAGLQAAYRESGRTAPDLATLATLAADALQHVQAADHAMRARTRAQEAVARTTQELQRLAEAQAVLADEGQADAPAWQALLRALQLSDATACGRVEARLETLAQLREALAARASAEQAVALEDARIAAFRAELTALVDALGEAAPAAGHEAVWLAQAQAALTEAEQQHAACLALEATAQQHRDEAERAERAAAQAQAELAQWRARAGVLDDKALDQVLECSAQAHELAAQIAALDETIAAATGAAQETLQTEALAADPDALQAERARLLDQIADGEQARETAVATRTRAQAECDAMDGRDAAAQAATAARECLAVIGREALNWVRLRLAHELLNQTVQRGRQRAQGPLLEAAARWLPRLTAGRWCDWAPDWVGDEQVLLAVRDDGLRLPLAQLSEGAADAAFLALRLAAIEVRRTVAPPVPLVLDDVLMSFDDERAGPALVALAELSASNQVIYFTHHRHLVDLARSVLPPERLAVQELQQRPV